MPQVPLFPEIVDGLSQHSSPFNVREAATGMDLLVAGVRHNGPRGPVAQAENVDFALDQ